MYGDLISTKDIDPIDINAGYAKRFDNLASLNTSKEGGEGDCCSEPLPQRYA